MSQQLLQKCLTKPCQLAHSLDWKKATGSTLLALDIHADRIGLARCDHPNGLREVMGSDDSAASSSCFPLESIPLSKKNKLSPEHKQRLADLVKEEKVRGFIISWPLEKSGKLGAACGRTLHTIDQLLEGQGIVSPNRPLCLWDSQHAQAEPVDSFGRCSSYAQQTPCHKTLHLASQEQYHSDEGIVAAQVWQDFCQQYWPTEDVAVAKQDKITATTKPSLIGGRKKVSYASKWQQANRSSQRQAQMAA